MTIQYVNPRKRVPIKRSLWKPPYPNVSGKSYRWWIMTECDDEDDILFCQRTIQRLANHFHFIAYNIVTGIHQNLDNGQIHFYYSEALLLTERKISYNRLYNKLSEYISRYTFNRLPRTISCRRPYGDTHEIFDRMNNPILRTKMHRIFRGSIKLFL